MKFKKIISILTMLSIASCSVLPNLNAVAAGSLSEQRGNTVVHSMLPLEEKKAYLVVGDHEDVDISAVPVEYVLENLLDSDGNRINIDNNAKIVWSYYKDLENNVISDDYFVIKDGGTLNLSLFDEYDQYSLEMIVGDGNQLNPDNVRYIVTVYLSDAVTEMRTYEFYTQDESGARHKVEPTAVDVQGAEMEIAGMTYSVRRILVPEHIEGTEYYLGVTSPMDEHPFIKLDVLTFDEYLKYMQYQALGQGYEYETVNDKLLNQKMTESGAGYSGTWDNKNADVIMQVLQNALFFIYRDEATGEILSMDCVKFVIDNTFSYFSDEAYSFNDGKLQDVKLSSEEKIGTPTDFELAGDQLVKFDTISINRVWLKKGCSPADRYYYRLDAHSSIWDNANEHVVKAVVGEYDSLESAAEAEDIKEQLLPTGEAYGYPANYDAENGGVLFTVFFDDDTIFKFLVAFYEYDPKRDADYIREYSDVPLIGEVDPWFRITGANNIYGNALDTYVVENGKKINVDTMYGYGYQTVFINDDADSIQPTFWLANSDLISVDSIYVNGRRFNAGDTISFADGENKINAMFSVIINDKNGKHTKNYNVSFVKKSRGAQLYVAGPLAPEVRSVFLDEYFEYKHDIFIANVGDTPLRDLKLELDAENVALDPYWTIGGAGNDTLAPSSGNFREELLSTSYGELSNVAKIRLVPNGESSGEIKGTLKIYSGSELLTVIDLSGRAQNPKIITSEVDDAVLYVPYSYLITTNNMYDWTDVDFKLSGNLPAGVDFYPETGEIYGVPLETGEFTFEIAADFSSETYSFDSSSVTLTMTVKDNTNYNVYTATDDEYTILNAIGTDIGGYDFVLNEYGDELFRSEGVLEQFVGLWLNGELLEEGTDYDVESGSTKITIYAQTFEDKANRDGTNTIAAEFRTSDTNNLNNSGNTNELKRTAQNFRLNINQQEAGDVSCAVRVVDTNGKAVQGLTLELRSTPQTGITNASGIASFKPIAFGSHTLYAKGANGSITAQKSFNIVSGAAFGVNGNTVTAVKGSSFVLDVVYDGAQLRLLTSDSHGSADSNASGTTNSNASGTVDSGSSGSGASSGNSADVPSPGTGDNFSLWLYISLMVGALIGILACLPRKNSKNIISK